MTSPEPLLNEFALVSLSEVAATSGFSARELEELIELGVLEPCGQEGAEPVFPARCIELARSARRLQLDFELPLAGAALALAYREGYASSRPGYACSNACCPSARAAERRTAATELARPMRLPARGGWRARRRGREAGINRCTTGAGRPLGYS